MYKYAMIGYCPSGGVCAVGNEGVTTVDARKLAAKAGVEVFQLFPLDKGQAGQHLFYRRKENGGYEKGQSREFAARLSEYVAKLIEKGVAGK